MATTLKPSHMASHLDLSPDTLRCYERAGFMPRVQRHKTIPERVVLLHEHRANVASQTAELQHDLEYSIGNRPTTPTPFGVTAGEATP